MKSFTFLLFLTMFLMPLSTKALPITNFGGQIIGIFPCGCSANWILYVRDVRYQFIPLVFQPGVTFLHKMYQPRPAVNSLGSYIPLAGQCWVYIGTGCAIVPTWGMRLNLGTSFSR